MNYCGQLYLLRQICYNLEQNHGSPDGHRRLIMLVNLLLMVEQNVANINSHASSKVKPYRL